MDKDGNASLHDSDSDNGIAYEDYSSEEEDPQAEYKGIPLSLNDTNKIILHIFAVVLLFKLNLRLPN